MRLALKLTMLLLLSCQIAGCTTDEIEELALTENERQKVIHIQNPFVQPIIKFKLGEGRPTYSFGIKGCEIYEAEVVEGVIVDWKKIIKPDFYPFGHTCTSGKMQVNEQGELIVNICTQGFGAGGGCHTKGIYKTKDGIEWQRRDHKKEEWIKYDK